jgi:hypothetical protein
MVEENGVNDAATARVKGFPYLRVDRFLCALIRQPRGTDAFGDWLHLAMEKALSAQQKEIMNLPKAAVDSLGAMARISPMTRASLIARARACDDRLLAYDRGQRGFKEAVVAASKVPSEYELSLRIAGLYPLASLPVAYLTHKAQREFQRWFDTAPDALPVRGHLVSYAPPSAGGADVAALLRSVPENAFGMPLLDDKDILGLAEAFAPRLVQDKTGTWDVPGRLQWQGTSLEVDSQRPSVYYYLSHAILKGRPVVQINYVVWYNARVGPEAPTLERGHLDGLTIRVTLDPTGIPLIVDTMNNCGCYHLFIPRKHLVTGKRDIPFSVDAFVPRQLPDAFPASPLEVRVSAGWHQVQGVSASGEPAETVRSYELVPYGEIESLPRSDGRFESVFDDRGIMKGSCRIEPYLLFPMGVPSVGAMRQRGHHPISLVGREYFDNPHLFEDSLEFIK